MNPKENWQTSSSEDNDIIMVSEETASHIEDKATSTLSPVAYNESVMPALRLVRSSRRARIVARMMVMLLVFSIVVIAFAPWQQSVRGEGQVFAYSPQARPQKIESRIEGQVIRWGEGIYENAYVEEGQMILEIADLDPNRLSNLTNQMASQELVVDAQKLVKKAAENSLEQTKEKVESYATQVEAFKQVKTQVIAAADAYVDMAREKLNAKKQKLEQLEAALAQEKADYERQKQLFNEKIVSELKFQMAQRKWQEAVGKVAEAKAEIEAARDELEGKTQEREAKAQEAQIKIDYAEAQLREGRADIAKSESEVAKAEAKLNKDTKDLSEIESKVAKQQNQIITAPVSGTIMNLISNKGGALIKKASPICTIVPKTEDRAVELWLSGIDVPLVSPGEHVRLQFEGWPAVQFSGWPSVAVGTFGGEVISVDQTDDLKGRFRTIILPDETHQEWPEDRFLRQGVRANGWVLLNRVPLWWEIWRQMNGFPLVIDSKNPDGKAEKTSSPAKIAKPK